MNRWGHRNVLAGGGGRGILSATHWLKKLLPLLTLLTVIVRGIAASPPNIVFVLADDLGYGDLGCHGNPVVQTPHIDGFAREGIRFTDFHVSPTCSPTRAALLTGRHEFRSGVTHTILERERLALDATTIAQVLKGAGYHTGIFGKWHLGDEPTYQPGRRGFDEVFIHGAGGIGQTYPGSCGDAPGNTYFDPAILHNGTFEKTKGYCTDVFFGEALKWMDRQRNNKSPFIAWIAPNAPHSPLQCPEDYAKRYADKVPENLAKFYGMIQNIDDNFGALLAKLKEWRLDQNTLVIFMGDNGSASGANFFNAGMRASKATPYNGGTRVASLWRWPAGFKGGMDVGKLTAHVDVFPTFAELAGAKIPERLKLDGRSLLPLWKDAAATWPERYLFTHVGRWPRGKAAESKYANCAVVGSQFHLVNNQELYEVKADPGERKNVFAEHPEAVAEMRQAYDQWWNDVLPALVNENAVGPKLNSFKELYWKQFGGGPDETLLKKMDPASPLEGRQEKGKATKTGSSSP
ncbi:MAG: arylsulfatase [Pedosphaera sp.]|nr:arylsulfatase [Pedosphaera sp.]